MVVSVRIELSPAVCIHSLISDSLEILDYALQHNHLITETNAIYHKEHIKVIFTTHEYSYPPTFSVSVVSSFCTLTTTQEERSHLFIDVFFLVASYALAKRFVGLSFI